MRRSIIRAGIEYQTYRVLQIESFKFSCVQYLSFFKEDYQSFFLCLSFTIMGYYEGRKLLMIQNCWWSNIKKLIKCITENLKVQCFLSTPFIWQHQYHLLIIFGNLFIFTLGHMKSWCSSLDSLVVFCVKYMDISTSAVWKDWFFLNKYYKWRKLTDWRI